MVEPLEETRSELVFATEPLLSSLYLAIPGSPYASSLVDLDEVEVSRIEPLECKGPSVHEGDYRSKKACYNFARPYRFSIRLRASSTPISTQRAF